MTLKLPLAPGSDEKTAGVLTPFRFDNECARQARRDEFHGESAGDYFCIETPTIALAIPNRLSRTSVTCGGSESEELGLTLRIWLSIE